MRVYDIKLVLTTCSHHLFKLTTKFNVHAHGKSVKCCFGSLLSGGRIERTVFFSVSSTNNCSGKCLKRLQLESIMYLYGEIASKRYTRYSSFTLTMSMVNKVSHYRSWKVYDCYFSQAFWALRLWRKACGLPSINLVRSLESKLPCFYNYLHNITISVYMERAHNKCQSVPFSWKAAWWPRISFWSRNMPPE